jgi:predicted lysophospholipase L1 biosynthesis ABC-type transport system permease subunit
MRASHALIAWLVLAVAAVWALFAVGELQAEGAAAAHNAAAVAELRLLGLTPLPPSDERTAARQSLQASLDAHTKARAMAGKPRALLGEPPFVLWAPEGAPAAPRAHAAPADGVSSGME